MFYLLSLLAGVLISVMVAFNGGLTELYGVYLATVIIHLAGLVLITIITLVKREKPFSRRHAWYLYLGGAMGVFTTVANNLAFGRISISAMLALSLLGESVTGLVVDQFGLMGMPTHPFVKHKLIGLALILGGIAAMIDNFVLLPVAVSFGAGVIIVISRTLNAKLSDLTSARTGTFFNYLTGMIVAIPVLLILGGMPDFSRLQISPDFYIYLGGMMGVCIIMISNIVVVKISAFYVTLFMFIGQVFAGILVDWVLAGEFSPRILIGGLLVTAGLCVNLLLDRRAAR